MKQRWVAGFFAQLLAGFFAVCVANSHAQAPAEPHALPFETKASHMFLMDADTGTVLAEKNADEQMFPSSMSKLMTLYVLFEELKKGTLKLDDTFHVSEKAWAIQGSKMFVPINSDVTIRDLISGIATQSGNDACIVVAEGLAGSEEAFAVRLNETAKRIGLTGSHFVNASGWPDENHYMTARDLAILARRLINDFPEYYHYFAEKEFTFNNIRQFNRNPLLDRTSLGVDGLKTGHTEVAGYGITLSAKHPSSGQRLVLVVNGLSSQKARGTESAALLNWGFRNFKNVTLAKAGDIVAHAPVWLGKKGELPLTVAETLTLTVPVTGAEAVSAKAVFESPVPAPIQAGDVVGELAITLPSGRSHHVPLIAQETIEKKGAFARIPAVISGWLGL